MKCIEKELLDDSVLAHEFAQRELALHSQMQHENIISVLSICETKTRYLMYMEYAGFESGYFARKIAQRKAITNQKKLKAWTKQLLSALAYVHGPCRVIHQDLKPENVLLNEEDS